MYEGFYGFTEKPFNITPDPKFLFLSAKHQEAISHLLYGIQERGGFIVITGEVGTGKTILCRYLLNQLDEQTDGAVILNPNLSALELLKAINEDFGIRTTGQTKKELIDELNFFLLDRTRRGRNMVLVIDEAQNLAPSVLEEVRLLSNLETEKEKLIQIILLGQPELRNLLQLPNLRQLNQRVTARYHLTPLEWSEAIEYIYHRMGVAGNREAATFTKAGLKRIFAFSGGTPRLINVLCDRLLLAGYAAGTTAITPQMVARAVREVAGDPPAQPRRWAGAVRVAAAAAAMAACIGAGWQLGGLSQSGPRLQAASALSVATAEAPVVPTPAATPRAGPAPEAAAPDPKRTPEPSPAPPAAPAPTPAVEPKPAAAPPSPAAPPAAPRPAADAPEQKPAPAKPSAQPATPAAGPAAGETGPARLEVAAAPAPARAATPSPSPPIASLSPEPEDVTPAERELQVISSLFTSSENRVRTRAPSIIEESLPPEPVRAAPTRTARATPPPAAVPVRMTDAREVAKLVSNLQPGASRLDAAAALCSLWGRDFRVPKEANDPNATDFYKLALHHGMRCSEVWANFDTLQRINLPGILEVFGPSAPTSRYVVLAAIHGDGTGTIVWGPGASARVDLQALDETWRRRAFIFWEDRERIGEIVKEGDTGDQVRWVQESLATLGYFSGPADGVYGPPTRSAVADFQRAYRLLPDGIVGPRTRMVLYSGLDGYPTPNLTPVGEASREHHQRGPEEAAG